MKKNLIFLVIFLIGYHSFGQITFQKGYFINTLGETINCEIKNIGWGINPVDFEYRLSQDESVKKISIKNVKEFGVYNEFKFIRSYVNIDTSNENLNFLSTSRDPVFEKKIVFLKLLLEGKASLYSYTDLNKQKYFYSKENSAIIPLIFKNYTLNNVNILQNNTYKNQIWKNLKCKGLSNKAIQRVKYNKSELITFFKKYNNCEGSGYIDYASNKQGKRFHLSITPRFNNITINHFSSPFSDDAMTKFKSKISGGFGFETEYILPFFQNKMALFTGLIYQNYSDLIENEATSKVSGGIVNTKLTSKSLSSPLGLRYYFFLNKKSKLFTNVSVAFTFYSNASVTFTRGDHSLINEIRADFVENISYGLGYKYNNRYSFEVRYEAVSSFLNINQLDTTYNTLSLILGYQLF